jgi:Kelch motif/Galactose oxidase, central domain
MLQYRLITLLCSVTLALAACDSGSVNPTAPPEGSANSIISNVVTGTWKIMPSLTPARGAMAAGVLGQSVVVVGGLTGNDGHAMWRVDAYDLQTKMWRQLKSLPESRFGVYGVTPIHGKLYVAGGSTTSPDGIVQSPVRTLFVYDTATKNWSRKADLPQASGCSGYQANLLGRLYVYQPCHGGPDNQAFLAYSPTNNTWTTRRPPPSFHAFGVAGVIDGKLYLTGGWRGPREDDTTIVLNPELDVYDPSTNTWTIKRPMPSARWQTPFATTGRGQLFIAGGVAQDSRVISADLQVYDALTDTWTFGPPMLHPEEGGASAWAGGKFFAIGGSDEHELLSEVGAFIPSH